jgi:hypothetical protein
LANSIVAYNEKQKNTPDYLEMDAEKLTAAIEYELNRNPVIDAVAGLARKYASNALHYIADWIREGKYQEKNWNPNTAGYDPLIEHSEVIARMVKNWKSFKQKQGVYIDMVYEIMEMLEETGLSQSANALETMVEIWQTVIDFIDVIMGTLESINIAIEAVNAFLCGFINAFVDLMAGIFDFVAAVVMLTDDMNRAIFKETLENLVQDHIQHPEKIGAALKDMWEALKERYNLDKPSYEIAYQLGEDTIDLLMLLDGIKLVITFVRALPKMFKNMLAWMERVVMKARTKFKGLKTKDVLNWKSEDWLSARIFRFSDDGEALRNMVRLLQREEEDIFHIVAHGNKNGKKADFLGKLLNAEEYAVVIKEQGWIEGTPIRLIVCHSGSLQNGFAAKLSKILKVNIEAPTNKIRVGDLGEFVHFEKGKFITFKP